MSDEIIIRIALILKVSADELLGLRDYQPNTPALSLRLAKRLAIIDD